MTLPLPMLAVLGGVTAAAGGAYAMARHCSRQAPVLMYHRVRDIPGDRLSVPPARFAEQMDYLTARGFTAITLGQLAAHLRDGAPLPARPVVITLDDAYDDNFTHALPVLRAHGMVATTFAIGDYVDAANDWEDYPGKPTCRTMTWEQLRAWRDAGMEVGSHTATHRNLATLTDAEIDEELARGKATLEAGLDAPVTTLCYPYGGHDRRVRAAAARAGFEAALAIFAGTSPWRNDLFALRRIPVTPKDRGRAFAAKVSPLHVISIALRNLERQVKGRP